MNVVVLMGRLCADPELKYTSTNIPVCSFRLAVDRSYKSGGERKTDFLSVTAWRQTGEFAAKYFRKGQLVAVEGSLETRQYTDKDGNNRTAFDIVASNVHFAESKRDGAGGGMMPSDQTAPARYNDAPPAAFSNMSSSEFEEIVGLEDDDLPF